MSEGGTHFEDQWWTEVRRDCLIPSSAFVHLDRLTVIHAFGAWNLRRKFENSSEGRIEGSFTHNFEFGQVVLPFAPVPFETWAHAHTRSDHGDSVFQSFRNERVIHGTFRNRPLPLCFAGSDKLLDE